MILQGINVASIVSDSVARAGHGPYVVPAVMSRLVIPLLMMSDVTPQRVAALADNLIPGILDDMLEEAEMPSGALH